MDEVTLQGINSTSLIGLFMPEKCYPGLPTLLLPMSPDHTIAHEHGFQTDEGQGLLFGPGAFLSRIKVLGEPTMMCARQRAHSSLSCLTTRPEVGNRFAKIEFQKMCVCTVINMTILSLAFFSYAKPRRFFRNK